ncbi:heme o synthase [Dichotomicrobium thermohalophilum]|uniref:Protoheme IX farnesyltransferase n=1 Tax=Dichotomicrobium thermohalophilum TaxID=933063 RepID=A0A397Q8K5_9HYPH|nr:heme o synthase [Dichotomicrobium thermohalophilum]RIA55867.1 protoheme IX farnesyltransferase [Dichotomicrobium thermohalophilum]
MTDQSVPFDITRQEAPQPQGFGSGRHGPARSQAVGTGELRDYWLLLKPRVMSLSIFTAFAGMIAAPGAIHPVLALAALLAIAAGAGAAGALNMWYDADIDAVMQRTAKRPLPRGRVSRDEVLTLGIVLGAGSVLCLGTMVNWVAGALLAGTILFYLVIYTMWLKRRTPQNIVIGGAAGAFPPMIGWAAVTGSVSLESLVLFAIIFFWTPPHFWALALVRSQDYQRAGVPMLPVVAGADATRWQILIYSVLLAPLGIAPTLFGFASVGYAIVAGALGAGLLALALETWRWREGPAADRAARRLFKFSILYLFGIFGALVVDHIAGWAI